jgi:hypothetical protein
LRQHLLDLERDDGQQDFALGAEVVVDRAGRQLRLGGDVLDPHGIIAAVAELPRRGVQQAAAAVCLVQGAKSGRRGPWRGIFVVNFKFDIDFKKLRAQSFSASRAIRAHRWEKDR